MRSDSTALAARIILITLIVAGWLVGLVGQRATVEETNYLDISPPLMLLGIGLCALAGALVRVVVTRRRVRDGAVGGIAMMAAIVAGYLALMIAYWDRFDTSGSGETWWTLLLESWFWVGVPLVVSAILGAFGWLAADALERLARQPARSP
ncbi:MAG TPA: hypothetical protein VF902_02285 [Coriobacteriia bacterium]